MFDQWAFRTWGHVIVGASVFAILFLGVMVMAEAVVADGPRVSRAALGLGIAAFVGYVGAAWIVRSDEFSTR